MSLILCKLSVQQLMDHCIYIKVVGLAEHMTFMSNYMLRCSHKDVWYTCVVAYAIYTLVLLSMISLNNTPNIKKK